MEAGTEVQGQTFSLSLGTTDIKDDQGAMVLKIELTPTHLRLYDTRGGLIIGMARYMIAYLASLPLTPIDERDRQLMALHDIVERLSPPRAIDYEEGEHRGYSPVGDEGA